MKLPFVTLVIPWSPCRFYVNALLTSFGGRYKSTTDTLVLLLSSMDNDLSGVSPPSYNYIKDTNINDGSSPSLSKIDPLLMKYISGNNIEQQTTTHMLGGNILEVSHGIQVWRHALSKGRLPIEDEFMQNALSIENPSSPTTRSYWPIQPLYDSLYNVMVNLQLPRLALRHPETIPTIIRSIIRYTIQYQQKISALEDENDDNKDDEDDTDNELGDEYYYDDMYWLYNDNIERQQDDDNNDITFSELNVIEYTPDSIGIEISKSLEKEWTGVVNGMTILDDLFGYDHGFLQVNDDDDDDDDKISSSTIGFGIDDGIWAHSGWEQIPVLQRQLSEIPELNDLIRSLGRRPSAEDGDKIQKFLPRKPEPDGGLGAEYDSRLRQSVTGITLSANLSEMLPSEAVLLRGSKPILRQLFLAKWAESKLLSYELSGYADIPSILRTKPLYRNRLPSASGGPIIVCLDTSWSMSGTREILSKAVVLACVSEAHKQGRDCQVVAFSTERRVMEAGIITADVSGIQRLLDFLSHSFGGGTDVTGSLKFAISSLNGSTDKEKDIMTEADILLVTDGEIADPPVPNDVMSVLDQLKLKKGYEIHGLLIGKKESKPLSRLCTHTHDFLSRYFEISSPGAVSDRSQDSTTRFGKRMSTALHAAKRTIYEDVDSMRGKQFRLSINKRKWPYIYRRKNNMFELKGLTDSEFDVPPSGIDFTEAVQVCLDKLKRTARDTVEEKLWTFKELEKEREESGSCWVCHAKLNAAVETVESGLVERGEDARLVVLAMIAKEHILLIGSPGTAKSVLGQRIAELCDGMFFQRLLTRFTTPEELFGPLSLKSLENDEYRRVTNGFLPTADVAFLDEIFKANSAILNTLLTILNERKFDNAGKRESCPIRCVVGASNELPESDELVALYDRFLIRKEVLPVSDEGVAQLVSMNNPGESDHKGGLDDLDSIIDTLSAAANKVIMDEQACELMRDLRFFMRQKQNVEISDRRLVKVTRLLKIVAATDGRKKVDNVDFLIAQHCFWNEPEQRLAVREWLWDNLTPYDGDSIGSMDQMRYLLDNLRTEIIDIVRRTNGDIDGTTGAKPQDVAVLGGLREESSRVAIIMQKQLNRLARHLELIRSDDFTWIDPDDVRALRQLLLPRGEKLWPEMVQLAEDAKGLELAISTGQSSPPNELRLDVIEMLWDDNGSTEIAFTESELEISMKEAKAKYDIETFRRWKKAKKKADKSLQQHS